MFILYDIAFLIFALVYMPVFLLKGKYHSKFKMKLGLLSRHTFEKLRQKEIIWIHAVSVGEVIAAKGIIKKLREKFQQCRIVVSTVTRAGNEVARTITNEEDLVMYLPFDISFIVKRVFKKTQIKAFILVETELWPNLILTLHRKKVPVFVVNGRISEKSFRSYRIIRSILEPLLGTIRLFLMQSRYDAQRIIKLGAPKEKVFVSGNIKFDVDGQGEDFEYKKSEIRTKLNLKSEDFLIVAGSTHPGEEEILLNVFSDLVLKYPLIKILIACRHIDRTNSIVKLVEDRNLSYRLFSDWKNADSSKKVIILDTIGDLKYLYSLAELVFVGGSLTKKGGHNIIEPACFEKPIISGQYLFNFQDISELFITNRAIFVAHDSGELKKYMDELIQDAHLRLLLGKKAKLLVEQNRGVTDKIINSIADEL